MSHAFMPCAALAVLAGACSTSAPAGDGGVVIPDANAAPDASRPDMGQPLEHVPIFVRGGANGVANASVAIDDADGNRHEAVTDTGGRTSISGVAWGSGQITISVSATGYPTHSLVSFRRSDLASRIDSTGAITIDLVAYYYTAVLNGTLTNVADPAHRFDVNLDVGGSVTVTGTSFTGSIQRATPFRICAVERVFAGASVYQWSNMVLSWVCLDEPSTSSPTTITLDMSANPLGLTTVSGNFVAPPNGHPLQVAAPGIYVSSDATDGRGGLGVVTSMAVGADGFSYDFSLAYPATLATGPVLTEYYVESVDRHYSSVRVDGLPGQAPLTQAAEWLTPPTLTMPSGGTAGLHDPIVVTVVDTSVPIFVDLRTQYGQAWTLEPAPGVTSFAFPQPPTGTDMRNWTNLTIQPYSCEPWPAHRVGCRREAGGDSVTVM